MFIRHQCFAIGILCMGAAACTSSKNDDSSRAASTGAKSDSGTCNNDDVASATTPCPGNPDPCNLKSGFAGDEYCIAAPPADEGVQIHFGPTDYSDPAQIANYELKPGEEFNAYGLTKIPTTEDKWYDYVQIRMRPGSHHLINTIVTGDNLKEGFLPNGQGCPGTQIGAIAGSQNLIYNEPPGGKPAPENVGIGSMMPGNAYMCSNYHAYNTTNDVHIREYWMNVWFVDKADVTQQAIPMFVIAGPWQGIAPHTQTALTQTADITGTGRIISMFGHRHAWTDRFAVWRNDDLVYDSFSWEEAVTYNYDSITKNPAPNVTTKTDGASSGILSINPGDKVKIECDVNNTSDNTLYFSNEIYGGEMCILFGSSVDTNVTAPSGIFPGVTAGADGGLVTRQEADAAAAAE